MTPLWCAWLVSYVVGAIPTGFLLVKWLKRVDIRAVGSGNTGATNALRAAGPKAGAAVLLLDGLKGYAAVTVVAPWVAPGLDAGLSCGVAAVAGHNFPMFLGFRGGKGVATTIGALLAAVPAVTVVALLVWLSVFALWRYVSVASIAFAVSIPLLQAVTQAPAHERLPGLVLAVLMIARHHANIRRVAAGTEPRFNKPR